jgi:N-sulfoglucosamine sulfohydrolase
LKFICVLEFKIWCFTFPQVIYLDMVHPAIVAPEVLNNKKFALKKYIALIFIYLFFTEVKAQQENNVPNIVWIVSEDNSPLLGCYGDKFATTPHLDKFASEGILYENAFATAPVCAPARSTLITGVYPPSMGTEHMRSSYPIPEFIKFFPAYLREAGYYTSNNAKKDYNTVDQPEVWNESSKNATYKNRQEGQPFFAVFNIAVSHESSLHKPLENLRHDPEKVPLPPYHPPTKEMKKDWAQYYDKIEMMDARVGELLQELEDSGLAENTIVFYYSDHGGVLGRSKRFMYESGLKVPLIVRFPEKYAHLAPGAPGSKTDRLVTFVDFAPTILSLANIPVPDYMQGKVFLGDRKLSPREYAFSFRGRMDERNDLVRSVRNKKYRYIRNYMPHKIYGQYLEYLWKAPSMISWEEAYYAGELNKAQSMFWEPKPAEELYDIQADPHNIKNLAGQESYKKVLNTMREANRQWQLEIKDGGFIPESIMMEISEKTTLYDYVRSGHYSLEKIMETAEMASSGDISYLTEIISRLKDEDPVVRYWAATGCIVLQKKAAPAEDELKQLLNDPEVSVRIAAAEALFQLGESGLALAALEEALKNDNLMARVQALNVLENMKHDIRPALKAIKALIPKDKPSNEYDVRAARKLVEELK